MNALFRPAESFTERAGLFVSLTGSTNSGKTFSALRLARGIAGPSGKIAVLDTEGGRTLHLKDHFKFDVSIMDPPFRPARFAEIAKEAEDGGYGCLVIDSFSMQWVGIGGVLDWQAQELQRMAGDDARKQERVKMASWIKPKSDHKAMVYSLLQRRMPIVFAIRGEESIKPSESGGKPEKIFKSICNSQFPFEVTVSFRLDSGRKGYVDLSDPKAWKMEGAHAGIFHDGDRISEDHGRALAEWARGELRVSGSPAMAENIANLISEGHAAAARGLDALRAYWLRIKPDRAAVGGLAQRDAWIAIATSVDAAGDDIPDMATGDAADDVGPTGAESGPSRMLEAESGEEGSASSPPTVREATLEKLRAAATNGAKKLRLVNGGLTPEERATMTNEDWIGLNAMAENVA